MTDTREATPRPMEARERLAEVMWRAEYKRGAGRERSVPWSEAGDTARKAWLPIADAVIAALHLTDAAALGLMDGEGVVAPKWLTLGQHDAAKHLNDRVKFYQAAIAACPYKENPND